MADGGVTGVSADEVTGLDDLDRAATLREIRKENKTVWGISLKLTAVSLDDNHTSIECSLRDWGVGNYRGCALEGVIGVRLRSILA
jgi:hypothetical protein